jgi:predicted O-linked N-acetylglucosamine transferase (SPINDLY family)
VKVTGLGGSAFPSVARHTRRFITAVTVAQALDLALQHHEAGRLREAESIYHQILAVQPGQSDAAHLLGVIAHQTGRNDQALEYIRHAIRANPANAAAHSNLGEVCRTLGRLDEAIASYRQALVLNPNPPGTRCNLGMALAACGRLSEAIEEFQRVIALCPDFAEAHNHLGAALSRQFRWDDAICSYRRAIQLKPAFPEAHTNLGLALAANHQFEQAIDSHQLALRLQPNSPEIWCNLGAALAGLKRLPRAVEAFRRAIQLKPDYAEACSNLGAALRDTGQIESAIAACQQAIRLNPEHPEAHNNLGNVLRDGGQLESAIAAHRRVVQLQPQNAEAYNNLGTDLMEKGELDEAISAFRHALTLLPGHSGARHNLGVALTAQGRAADAVSLYREALLNNPEIQRIHASLLYALEFAPAVTRPEIAEEQERWQQKFAVPSKPFAGYSNDRRPDRRLRLGYVSPEFRDHVTGRYLRPLFQNHDHSQFEIFCYAGVVRPDGMTQEFQSRADGWRNTIGVPDEDLARMIKQDGVDILVDLTQHLAGNRLLAFAQKPAPVQASLAGYPERTGLEAIRYRISDRWLEGEGKMQVAGHRFQEGDAAAADHPASWGLHPESGLFLVDSFWCYDPCGIALAVNESPVAQTSRITFGSLNSYTKINEAVLTLWARVLREVRDSTLVLLTGKGEQRRQTMDFLASQGVEPRRIKFLSPCPREDYLELYHRIDVALDPFPYGGHTTSLDALWMGVPVVSLAGERPVSRAGLSILNNLGLPELVAITQDEYVRIASELARDRERLAGLRQTLRRRMEASVLMDGAHFTGMIESAYRSMWHRWCRE